MKDVSQGELAPAGGCITAKAAFQPKPAKIVTAEQNSKGDFRIPGCN